MCKSFRIDETCARRRSANCLFNTFHAWRNVVIRQLIRWRLFSLSLSRCYFGSRLNFSVCHFLHVRNNDFVCNWIKVNKMRVHRIHNRREYTFADSNFSLKYSWMNEFWPIFRIALRPNSTHFHSRLWTWQTQSFLLDKKMKSLTVFPYFRWIEGMRAVRALVKSLLFIIESNNTVEKSVWFQQSVSVVSLKTNRCMFFSTFLIRNKYLKKTQTNTAWTCLFSFLSAVFSFHFGIYICRSN